MSKILKRQLGLVAALSLFVIFSAKANDELLQMLKSHNIKKSEVQMIVEQMQKNGQINNQEANDAKSALDSMSKNDFVKLQKKGHASVKSKGMVNLTDSYRPKNKGQAASSLPSQGQIDKLMKALKN